MSPFSSVSCDTSPPSFSLRALPSSVRSHVRRDARRLYIGSISTSPTMEPIKKSSCVRRGGAQACAHHLSSRSSSSSSPTRRRTSPSVVRARPASSLSSSCAAPLSPRPPRRNSSNEAAHGRLKKMRRASVWRSRFSSAVFSRSQASRSASAVSARAVCSSTRAYFWQLFGACRRRT